MFSSVLRFVRLPLLLVTIWTVVRFTLGVAGVPYAPRGNAMFSVYSVMLISCLYFGALSNKIGGFKWGGTILTGVTIGVYAQILILLATLISYAGNLNTYFVHWDALNVPEGTIVPLGKALATRAGGIVFNGISAGIFAIIGRALSGLAPKTTA